MAMAGGPANANGILYQVLGVLGRAVELAVTATPSGDDPDSMILVIEPITGGDLQLIGKSERTVEQWKTRAGGKAWSLASLIDDVLPDLYGAVQHDAATYRFVTEGKIGTWDLALSFFKTLGPTPSGPGLLEHLDDRDPVEFSKGEWCTRRQLFLRIVTSVRRRNPQEPIDTSYERLWKLLSRFEFAPELAPLALDEAIREKLQAIVERREDVPAKQTELCGWILKLSAQGNAKTTPEALLKLANLTPTSFLSWNPLRETLRQRLTHRLEQIGIDLANDVRSTNPVLTVAPVTVITGNSGQGKTWLLASLATKYAKGPGLAVWVPTERGERGADEIAAEEIWQEGLGKDGTLSLAALARRRAEANPQAPASWGIVCVDGVHSRKEAAYLGGLDWESWGLRLVITAPPDVASYLKTHFGKRIHSTTAEDFSPPELREYLIKRGRGWADTPPDVRSIIRRPILAQLFADLADDPSWTPRHEYELMEAYWQRIRNHQSGELQDLAFIRALAARVLGEAPVYPWPPEVLQECGVSPEALKRLKDSGWLREVDAGAVEMWHDRLLCWAVAEYIAHQRRVGTLTTKQVADTLRTLNGRVDPWGLRLQYVSLDVVWQLTATGSPDLNEAWNFVAALERSGGWGFEAEGLYKEILPTLGSRIVSPVVERIRHVPEAEMSPYPKLAASTLAAVGKREAKPVQDLIAACVADKQESMQELALRLLPDLPDARHLDKVWAVHCAWMSKEERNHARYDLGFSAMSACLQYDPAWLGRQVATAKEGDPHLPELTYLLARVRGPAAASVWSQYKSRLFEIIPANKRRSLVNCIFAFRDQSELDRLAEWTASTDEIVGPWSLWVLSLFDPARAASLIGNVPVPALWMTDRRVASLFAVLMPGCIGREVRRLSGQRPADAYFYCDLLGAVSDQIAATDVDLIVDDLNGRLETYLQAPASEEGKQRLHRALSRLSKMRGQHVLDALHARCGSLFENRLAEFACQWADNNSGIVDDEFRSAKKILKRIGGDGFTRVINAQLKATSKHSRLEGCQDAPIHPDQETRRLVADTSQQEELWTGGGEPFPVVQQKAITALAAMGEGAELVRAVMRWGTRISPDVSEVREGQPPLSDEDILAAVNMLKDGPSDDQADAVLAIGLSGRLDKRAQIEALFLQTPLSSQLALTAMLALVELGGQSPEIRERLLGQYRSGKHKFGALKLLVTGDEREAAKVLADALPKSGPYDELDQRIIGYLGMGDETRDLVEPRLREVYGERRGIVYATGIDPAGLLDPHDPADQHRLWETASAAGRRSWFQGSRTVAITRLARVHQTAAFEIGQQAFLDKHEDQFQTARALLTIDAQRAVPYLIEESVAAYDRKLCRIVGVSLRAHREHAALLLRSHLLGSSWKGRRVAACVAGYLGVHALSGDLKQRVALDDQLEVCQSAVSALRRQQREADAIALIARFVAAVGIEGWALADEIIHLADPTALLNHTDVLGFSPVLNQKPFVLRTRIWEALRKDEEKIAKDLESFTRAWDSE